jgi:hypothetical protein
MSSGGTIILSGGTYFGNTAQCAPGIFLFGSLSISGNVQLSDGNSIEVVSGNTITQTGPITGQNIPVSLFGGNLTSWTGSAVVTNGGALEPGKFKLLDVTGLSGGDTRTTTSIPADYFLDAAGQFQQ